MTDHLTTLTDGQGLCYPRCPNARHLGHPSSVVVLTSLGTWATRQKRGTGGTLVSAWKECRDRGHPPRHRMIAWEMNYWHRLSRIVNCYQASRCDQQQKYLRALCRVSRLTQGCQSANYTALPLDLYYFPCYLVPAK